MATTFSLTLNKRCGLFTSPDPLWSGTSQVQRHMMYTETRIGENGTGDLVYFSNNTLNWKELDRQYYSMPLLTGGLISGGIASGQCMGREYNANNNINHWTASLKVVSTDGRTIRGTLIPVGNYNPTGEFGNGPQHINRMIFSGISLSPVTALAGDRIMLELGYTHDVSSTTIPTGSARYGDNGNLLAIGQAGTNYARPWISIPQTLSFRTGNLYRAIE